MASAVILGAGNVATNLAPALLKAGIENADAIASTTDADKST